MPEVQQWWKDNVGHDAEEYERDIIDRFGRDGEPELLIVVDKLLTGFDEATLWEEKGSIVFKRLIF